MCQLNGAENYIRSRWNARVGPFLGFFFLFGFDTIEVLAPSGVLYFPLFLSSESSPIFHWLLQLFTRAGRKSSVIQSTVEGKNPGKEKLLAH